MTGTTSTADGSPLGLAQVAEEAVRELIHATQSPGDYTTPAQVDAVLAELALLVDRLPQALGQARAWLMTAHHTGQVGHDEYRTTEDVEGVVLSAARTLRYAAAHLDAASACLSEARHDTSHLTSVGVVR